MLHIQKRHVAHICAATSFHAHMRLARELFEEAEDYVDSVDANDRKVAREEALEAAAEGDVIIECIMTTVAHD